MFGVCSGVWRMFWCLAYVLVFGVCSGVLFVLVLGVCSGVYCLSWCTVLLMYWCLANVHNAAT